MNDSPELSSSKGGETSFISCRRIRCGRSGSSSVTEFTFFPYKRTSFFSNKKKNLRRTFKNTVSQLEIGSRKNYLTQRVFKLKNLSLNARKNTDRMAFKTFPTPFEQVIVGCSLIRRILLFFFCFFF